MLVSFFSHPVTEKLRGPPSHRRLVFLRRRVFLPNTGEFTDAIIASLIHIYDMKLESLNHFSVIQVSSFHLI
jgi:hypothetical protein